MGGRRPGTRRLPGAWRRLGMLAAVAGSVALASPAGPASGAPAPTIAQVQRKLAELNARAGRLGQQYDQVLSQLAEATQRLKLLNRETAQFSAEFRALQSQVSRIAIVAYEQGSVDLTVVLLTTASPQRVLGQASILTELSDVNGAQIRRYLAASRQLLSAQQAARRERAGIAQVRRALGKRLAVLRALQAKQKALLAQLTPPQRSGLVPGGGTGGGTYHGPTRTQAEKAVAFAYSQVGCPYVYGGTGPCSAGYDCSGLMMAAWAHAGVQIPRVSWDQMSSLPAVPLHTSSGAFTERYLQPGDILGFAGNSHVGMYVGGGYLIDAPVPGQYVEKIALAGWYLQNLDGAVRP